MAERDIGSLRMMGWGLMLAENSSVVAAAVPRVGQGQVKGVRLKGFVSFYLF